MSITEKFELTDGDFYAISLAIDTARLFLAHPKITPLQVIGLGNALYALERLPLATPGAFSRFGIECRAGKKEFNENRSIYFTIADDYFEISQGGHGRDKSADGGDYPEPGWLFMADGYRDEQCDLYEIEDRIKEYLDLGAAITVIDESDIEYEKDDTVLYDEQDELNDEVEHDEYDCGCEHTHFPFDDGPKNVRVSRQDVERQNIRPVLSVLSGFTASPQIAGAHMEKVDISFAGYEQDDRRPFEIPEVRDFVNLLDEHFPYWLFFLAKNCPGLQSIAFCFLLPHLADGAKAARQPWQLQELLTKRWLPAMHQISRYAGLDKDEIAELTDRAWRYFNSAKY
ncbi:MAG: hypothetical protein PHO01_12035 [Desulfotomaculaceae bacterium]|nr:hypothetical protein [Desulfotomaculaceae bacterium]